MLLRNWEDLPDFMRVDEVRPYYEVLKHHKGSLILKRVFDLVAGSVLLIIFAVPMVVIAIEIKKDSPGPVFYRQERVTTYGKKFKIHKFRTMVDGADRKGSTVTVDHDSRITKVGAKLRDKRLEGNDIIGQTTESLVNKGFREVSPIHFFTGRDLFSKRTDLIDIEGGMNLLAVNQGQEAFRVA